MVIAEINSGNYGSTGRIMLGIQDIATQQGVEVYSYYALGDVDKSRENSFKICNGFSQKTTSLLSHATGRLGCFSVFTTQKLINKLKKQKVDIIHLHNIHVPFINYAILFNYIKKNDIRVIWTLHDCWSITGHCTHFTYPKCDKWKTQCFNCPRYKEYPASVFDNSKTMYKLKKKYFLNIKNMTLITPSNWLKGVVEQSFLSCYPIKVINNGIEIEKFVDVNSDFKEKNKIGTKKVVLGVSYFWNEKKGLDVFIELAKRLEPDKYQVVLVGTNDKIDTLLPKNVISIHRTNNFEEIIGIYKAADVFVNPTREDNFPTVNIEANICGKPVVMFDTGGSPETISSLSGCVIACNDVDGMENKIREITQHNIYLPENCIEQAKRFDMYKKFQEYVDLYKEC